MGKNIIDEKKLSEAMEIIEKANVLMEEKDCDNNKEAKEELTAMQKRLQDITGNKDIDISCFQTYWEYTSLETIAKKAFMPSAQKSNLTDREIKEIVLNILEYDEAEMDYWIEFLEVNTGLINLSDYIFYPDLIGLDKDASLEEIADKIIVDKK